MVDVECQRRPVVGPRKNRTRTKSFTEALKEKYCTEEDWDTERYQNIKIVTAGRPKIKNKDGEVELSFLTNVVLNQSSVSHAGIPDEGLAKLCPNVVDLDISNNLIEHWSEIIPIIAELPHLKFVNLSKNKLNSDPDFFAKWKINLNNIENLVLNSTGVPWQDVIKVTNLLPKLKELHICRNGYSKIDDSNLGAIKSIKCLRLNDNRITRWEEIWKLRYLPNLTSLILSGNPLLDIFYNEDDLNDSGITPDNCGQCNEDDEKLAEAAGAVIEELEEGDTSLKEDERVSPPPDATEDEGFNDENPVDEVTEEFKKNTLSEPENTKEEDEESPRKCEACGREFVEESTVDVKPFGKLVLLCISETLLSSWKDLEGLAKFPSLQSLRVKDVSLLCHVPVEDRRKLFLACLPNISLLNGSEVMPTELEKSERFFLRQFSTVKHKPARYMDLVEKHGKLMPLQEIDLSFGLKEFAQLTFFYKGIEIHRNSIRILDPVEKLRIYVSCHLIKPIDSLRIFHLPCGQGHQQSKQKKEPVLEEFRVMTDSLPMSRFDVMDGDHIHIEDADS